jgi:N-acetylglucosamine kinase-like BadF-type ATPase
MTRYFLGVDVGNTKTHALICSEDGTAVGAHTGGAANHEAHGHAGFQRILNEVVAQAISRGGIERADIAAAGFGIAGYDWDEDLPLMREAIASLGLDVPYGLMNDSGPGLLAGSTKGWGVSVAGGTGENARGRDKHGNEGRVTGEGLLFAEWGGGGDLVFRAIQGISRQWSKRGPETVLTDIFLREFGAKDVDDLLAGLARGRYHIRATMAPLVFQAAADGDAVAIEAVRWNGQGLGDLACGIIRQLSLEDEEVEVVLSGSIYKGSPLIEAEIRDMVLKVAPKAVFIHVTAPPVTGAVMLAMEQVGIDFVPLRERIIETGAPLLLAQAEKD